MKISTLKILSLLLVVSMAISSCMKNSGVSPVTVSDPQKNSTRLFSVLDYDVSSETGDLVVVFYESQRVYTVPSNAPNFQSAMSMLSQSKLEHQPIRVALAAETQISDITPPSILDLSDYQARFTGEADVRDIPVLPNIQEVNDIFQFCAAQNCEDGNAVIDYCIPFQYKIDGCYARAHKMRQIMEDYYGYECGKIFSQGGIAHSLAVDAGDCCVFWGWHVAPLVKVNTQDGVEDIVIDPSLFTHPVPVDTWLAIQTDEGCDPHAKLASYQITPGSWYFSDGTKDGNYHSTDQVLLLYRDLQTCE